MFLFSLLACLLACSSPPPPCFQGTILSINRTVGVSIRRAIFSLLALLFAKETFAPPARAGFERLPFQSVYVNPFSHYSYQLEKLGGIGLERLKRRVEGTNSARSFAFLIEGVFPPTDESRAKMDHEVEVQVGIRKN